MATTTWLGHCKPTIHFLVYPSGKGRHTFLADPPDTPSWSVGKHYTKPHPGPHDLGKHRDIGDSLREAEDNKHATDEARSRHGEKHKSPGGRHTSRETSCKMKGVTDVPYVTGK